MSDNVNDNNVQKKTTEQSASQSVSPSAVPAGEQSVEQPASTEPAAAEPSDSAVKAESGTVPASSDASGSACSCGDDCECGDDCDCGTEQKHDEGCSCGCNDDKNDKKADGAVCSCGDKCECDTEQKHDDGSEKTAAKPLKPEYAKHDGDKPPVPGMDSDACGCHHHGKHDGKHDDSKHSRRSSLTFALSIAGVVLGGIALVVSCQTASDVANLKSDYQNDSVSSITVPYGNQYNRRDESASRLLDELLREYENNENSNNRDGSSSALGNGLSDNYAGFIGCNIQNSDAGILVVGITSGGPAEKAGLKTGDVIKSFDGTSYSDVDALVSAIRSSKPGDSKSLVVSRNGDDVNLTVTIGSTLDSSSASHDSDDSDESEDENSNSSSSSHVHGLDGGGATQSN